MWEGLGLGRSKMHTVSKYGCHVIACDNKAVLTLRGIVKFFCWLKLCV